MNVSAGFQKTYIPDIQDISQFDIWLDNLILLDRQNVQAKPSLFRQNVEDIGQLYFSGALYVRLSSCFLFFQTENEGSVTFSAVILFS